MKLGSVLVPTVGLLLVVVFPVLAREWTDSTGGVSVEAELVEVKGDEVVLKKPTGSVFTVPIARLSSTDQEYLKSLGKLGSRTKDGSPAAAAEPAKLTENWYTVVEGHEYDGKSMITMKF